MSGPPAAPPTRFQGRGMLLEGALYIERSADKELLSILRRGGAAYVLGPRQVGKSNLRVRVERALAREGTRCSAVDLSGLDRPSDAETWYHGILVKIARDLKLPIPLAGWPEGAGLPAAQRFTMYLRDVILESSPAPLVIFFDEIDATFALPFDRDTFFLAIRSLYQERARDPALHRLSFCFVGVSHPMDLVAHPDLTNVGIPEQVFLEDFTFDELRVALPLFSSFEDPERMLREVFSWTEGHPAMTQQVCEDVLFAEPDEPRGEGVVRRVVEERYLSGSKDEILADIERRFTRASRVAKDVPGMLSLYRRVLKGERPRIDDEPAAQSLRLVGLVADRLLDGALHVIPRNRIFSTVFGIDWVRSHAQERPFVAALHAWLDAGRHADYLLRGKALERARAWAKDRHDITNEERELLETSVEAEQAVIDAKRRIELRSRMRTIVFLTLAALIASMWLLVEIRRRREQERRDAETSLVLSSYRDDLQSNQRRLNDSLAAQEDALLELERAKQDVLAAQRQSMAAASSAVAAETAKRDAQLRVELANQRLKTAQNQADAALVAERDLNLRVTNELSESSVSLRNAVVEAQSVLDERNRALAEARKKITELNDRLQVMDAEHNSAMFKLKNELSDCKQRCLPP